MSGNERKVTREPTNSTVGGKMDEGDVASVRAQGERAAKKTEEDEGEQKRRSKEVKLLPGERLGWWSAQRFDRRIRMRALVMGAVNDQRTRILLDTGANVSVIDEGYAKKMRLKVVTGGDKRIEIQGIGEGKLETTARTTVKITLGWEMVYEFEMWVMPHSAGTDVVLGTDFMMPAGVRLDLFHATVKLPNEVMVPLIKTRNMVEAGRPHPGIPAGPREDLHILGREFDEFKLPRKRPSDETHVLWVRRTKDLIPTVKENRRGIPTWVRLTNVSQGLVLCSENFPFVLWIPHGDLPSDSGYVRLSSKKYHDWQVLAYEGVKDHHLYKRERQMYDRWLAQQPAAVERRPYVTPTQVLERPPREQLPHGQRELTCEEQWAHRIASNELTDDLIEESHSVKISPDTSPRKPTTVSVAECESSRSTASNMTRTLTDLKQPNPDLAPEATNEADVEARLATARWGDLEVQDEPPRISSAQLLCSEQRQGSGDRALSTCPDKRRRRPGLVEIPELGELPHEDAEAERERAMSSEAVQLDILEQLFLTAATTVEADDEGNFALTAKGFEHVASEMDLEDYAKELAFLPDLTEPTETSLDYDGANVRNPDLSPEEQEKLIKQLQVHEAIMIASGNALPPPAYGAVCDIDVQGHEPIKQRARRIPLRYLRKLFELLKGLLKAGLIAFSCSPWASPIVIVLKKNGTDIRLCIDYKMVNAITMIMEYSMPLVDDLLTELESYLWFCSLDAASGFWAILMTLRARWISAFLCALGHFEWLRMPFGLKNAPMIYQRLIDNALWGFVQPVGGWAAFAARMRKAEALAQLLRQRFAVDPKLQPTQLTEPKSKFEADLEALAANDPLLELVNSPEADMFKIGEPDASALAPVLDRLSFVDDICFGGTDFNDCLATLDRLLARFTECGISVSFTKSTFIQTSVDFLSHIVSRVGIQAHPKKMAAIAELPFPSNKKGMQSFLGALNYYSRFIQNLAVYGAVLYQLKESDFEAGADLTAAKEAFATLKTKVTEAPILRHFARNKEVHVMLFANEWALSATLMQKHEGLLHPVRFCGRVLKDAEANYMPPEKEVLALLQVLKLCYTQLAGRTIHVYTRFSTMEWVYQSKSLFGRALQFSVLLSPWHLKVKRVRENDCEFAQLLQASITPYIGLDEALAPIAPPSKGSVKVRMDPSLLYARLQTAFTGYVMSFDGSAKTDKHGGYGSCSWILWRLPAWDIVFAASAYLPSSTVNIAEYTGMNNGVTAALAHGVTELIIVGDSRLAIQQSMGVMACRKDTLLAQLMQHKDLTNQLVSVKYLHVIHEFNAAADSLASEALELKESRTVTTKDQLEALKTLNRIPEVIYQATDNETELKMPSKSNFTQIASTTRAAKRKTFVSFAQLHEPSCGEVPRVTVSTRSQLKKVRFADETQKPEARKPTDPANCRSKQVTAPVKTWPEPTLPRPPKPTGANRKDKTTAVKQPESRGSSPNALDYDPAKVQAERRCRISKAQDEEERWFAVKSLLRGETENLTYKQAREINKVTDHFVLTEDGLLYYVGKGRRWENGDMGEQLRLVVPTTMIEEVLANCHDSIEGGHQGVVRTYQKVKQDYYWLGLYADVERHVKSCADCSSSKSKPHLQGYSPGNVLAERPFQLVSMDFVIPLPKSRRGNTALLLFQCSFTGFVIARAMSDTSALMVARAFEECVYRPYGAPSLVRHDRDPRFMSEVFQAFLEMMQTTSRATLSYRPQANGQQERSVKSMIQTVRIYVEDPLQQDWDDIAERLVHAINNSQDTTRKDTPHYLLHGWDARSTLVAMATSLRQGESRQQTDAVAWRREINRQQEVALELAKEYQKKEKARRAEKHNRALSRLEKRALPEDARDGSTEPGHRSLFQKGSRVWLYMERVKPGLTKKLAHLWHGPFRVEEKIEEYAYKLQLPDRSGYRFYPVVHVSRLKAVTEYSSRPTVKLANEVTEATRLDFDEQLLPSDSWEADHRDGEFEVEAILDDRTPLATNTARAVREFLVKWKGYDEATWEPASNLSCGGLLYDYLQEKKRASRLQMVQVADEA